MSLSTARKTLDALRGLGELLGIYSPQSRGLTTLKRRVNMLTSGVDFNELTELLELNGDMSADDIFTLRAELDDGARVSSYELMEIKHPAPVSEAAGIHKLFAKKSAPPMPSGIRVADRFGVLRNELLGGALREVAELAYAISKAIFDEFTPLSRELYFYEAAFAYVGAMKAKKLPLCYPELTKDGGSRLTELYDLHLCAFYPAADTIVPNDADLSSSGIVITGGNNTGKTVFLRSIGTAQLLAQAGLPVLAREASLRVRSGVYTLYAAAEKEFDAGNDAGRFEQEVRLLAAMTREIKPGALVLLNELFQTTAYSEGAEGLYHILCYLRSDAVGADFVAVTHLTDLVALLGERAAHLRTLDGYKLQRVTP